MKTKTVVCKCGEFGEDRISRFIKGKNIRIYANYTAKCVRYSAFHERRKAPRFERMEGTDGKAGSWIQR